MAPSNGDGPKCSRPGCDNDAQLMVSNPYGGPKEPICSSCFNSEGRTGLE